MTKLFLILLMAWPSLVQARTLSQLRTDARVLVSDNGTRTRFSDSVINNWLNEGQRLLAARTMCFKTSVKMAMTARTTYYSMPTNFIAASRVVSADQALTEMSVAGLDGKSRGWEIATGQPTYYFVNFSSRGKLGLAPFPSSSEDGDPFKVEYYAYPDTMSADGDSPFNGNPEFTAHHHGLPFYAAMQMSLVDGRPDQAKAHLDIFMAYQQMINASCKDRPDYLPQAAGRQ